MKRRVLLVLAVVGALVACTPQPAGPKVLNREATAEDKLPEYVTLSEGFDVRSARLLVEHDGVRYFAVKGNETSYACLAVVADDMPDWVAGCGGAGRGTDIVTVSSSPLRIEAKFINDGVDTTRPEYQGLTKIHDNVLISQPSRY